MRFLALLIPIIALVLIDCSDTSRLSRKEDRLIGKWQFEKAFYKNDRALFRENITDEFEGDIIEFSSDYKAVYDDASEGLLFHGHWNLVLERVTPEADKDVDVYLDMSFYNDIGELKIAYSTNVKYLIQETIELTTYDVEGRYTFKLRKINRP